MRGTHLLKANVSQSGSTTQEIIGAAFEVYNHLGCGFLEKVYKNAMKIELDLCGVPCALEAPIKVVFKGKTAGGRAVK